MWHNTPKPTKFAHLIILFTVGLKVHISPGHDCHPYRKMGEQDWCSSHAHMTWHPLHRGCAPAWRGSSGVMRLWSHCLGQAPPYGPAGILPWLLMLPLPSRLPRAGIFCDCRSFLTLLFQTYWSLRNHFPFGTSRVNSGSVSNMDELSIQSKGSLVSHVWLLRHEKRDKLWSTRAFTPTFNLFQRAHTYFLTFLFIFLCWLWSMDSPFLSCFRVMLRLLMKCFSDVTFLLIPLL